MKPLQIVLLAVSLSFLFLNFVHYNINEDPAEVIIKEKFDPSLKRLNSLTKLTAYVDSLAAIKKLAPGTLEYAIAAKEVISERFYHKYSSKDLNENWIASVAQKITGLSLSSNITANDILAKPYGYCGQQSAVLMELLESKNLKCRALYFPHHFVMQSFINGRWYYFDPDMEPDILPEQRSNKAWLYNDDSLAIAYRTDTNFVNIGFGHPIQIRYGKINEKQGPNAQIFQEVTNILSKFAFVFPLLWCVYLSRKKQIIFCNQPLQANSLTQEPLFLQ